jgi:hypothetical protein
VARSEGTNPSGRRRATDTATFTWTITTPNAVTITGQGVQIDYINYPIPELDLAVDDTGIVPAGTITCTDGGTLPAGSRSPTK